MSSPDLDAATILVVEDEPAYVDALETALTKEGFRVAVAVDGAEALERFDMVEPDLVLLDVMLPRVSGVDVCRMLRAKSTVPIIMVTAKSSEVDAVVGLEVGADDYVTKPYRMRELVARIRSSLRRVELSDAALAEAAQQSAEAGEESGDEAPSGPVVVGSVSIDSDRYEVKVDGVDVQLPLKEFELLAYLMANAGRVLTRDALIDRVWGHDYVGDTKTLDVHIKRLRSKVEQDPSSPTRIVTIRGLGYKFEAPTI